jgi:hypothetical protein
MQKIPAFYCNTSKDYKSSLNLKEFSIPSRFFWNIDNPHPKDLKDHLYKLKKVIVFITGAPASGKSVFCRKLLNEKDTEKNFLIRKLNPKIKDGIFFFETQSRFSDKNTAYILDGDSFFREFYSYYSGNSDKNCKGEAYIDIIQKFPAPWRFWEGDKINREINQFIDTLIIKLKLECDYIRFDHGSFSYFSCFISFTK